MNSAATSSPLIAPLVQAFFAEHLLHHKNVSPQTVAAYRDSFRLLLTFIQQRCGTEPVALRVQDLDAPVVLDFLDHLELNRDNTARSRNARLAAIRSFYRFVALREPACLGVASRVLAIPNKRAQRRLVGFLTRPEIDAVLAAPDPAQWAGRRDHALLLTLYNTGARVSEITLLRQHQLALDTGPSVQLLGKGRKQRAVPLWSRTARVLRRWLDELGTGPQAPAFPNARGQPLTRHGVAFLLRKATECACATCPSLGNKPVSPHTIRHTTAMHLLQSGVDPAVIALWLGHESVETTHVYVEADLSMKKKALDKLSPAGRLGRRFKPSDELMGFLATL
jgi:integrase/recombinase XerD